MTGHDWQDPEAPEADATEQSLSIDPDEPDEEAPESIGDEVNEADALEQARTVPEGEDERR